MIWLRQRKYLVLMAALVILLVISPLLSDTARGRWALDALTTLVFLGGIFVVFADKVQRRLALVLGIPALLDNWSTVAQLSEPPLAVVLNAGSVLFVSFIVLVVLRSMFRAERITADSVRGAFCCYLLIGLAFGDAYCIVELLQPGSFRTETGTMGFPDELARRSALTYMSFVTLTTVGFGDVTPATAAARWLAVAEAIFGQFYIAILVAELVGKSVAQALLEPRSQAFFLEPAPDPVKASDPLKASG